MNKNIKTIIKWKKEHPDKVLEINRKYEERHREERAIKARIKYRNKNIVKPDNYRVDDAGNKIYKISIGKFRKYKVRFAVLKRDNFTCQYCGRKPPEVILEVDHIYPKSKGGLNKIENYKTACRDCNIGKGVDILEVI